MDVKTGIALKPGGDFGVLMSGIVVADDVKLEFGSDLLVDSEQEGEPLLMAMARGGVSKYLAGKVVQSGKESHRSMPVVVVGLGANVSLAQRQAGLRLTSSSRRAKRYLAWGGAHVRFFPTRFSSPTPQKVEPRQAIVRQSIFLSITSRRRLMLTDQPPQYLALASAERGGSRSRH